MFGKETYEDYLSSVDWSHKRTQALEEAENKCYCCGSSENLQVHHIKYTEIEGKDVSPVVVLCKDCHSKLHAGAKEMKEKYGPILDIMLDSMVAEMLLKQWNGKIIPGHTTRMCNAMYSEFYRIRGSSTIRPLAPMIYKSRVKRWTMIDNVLEVL